LSSERAFFFAPGFLALLGFDPAGDLFSSYWYKIYSSYSSS
jgi:hypothetical protein